MESELRNALKTVPRKQREALILVVMVGCTYEEAATICQCEIGTIKSRVNRAKGRIARALGCNGTGEAPMEPTRRSRSDDARRLRVLIVEDELVIASEYERMIAELGGMAVGKTATAADASTLAAMHRPDLILMDVRLRGTIDGVVAAHKIQAIRATSIAFVTSYHDEETRRRIRLFNGSVPLHKPLGLHDLASIMYAIARDDRATRSRSGETITENAD